MHHQRQCLKCSAALYSFTKMLTKKKGDEIITVMDNPFQTNIHTTLEWSRTNSCLEVRKSIVKRTMCFRKWSMIKYSRFVVNGLKHVKPQVLYDPLSLCFSSHHAAFTDTSVSALALVEHIGMYLTDHTVNNEISAELFKLCYRNKIPRNMSDYS